MTKTMHTPYRSSQIAIDQRRAADAGAQSSEARYLAQIAAQRAQAERERVAFWDAAQRLADRQPVDVPTLDLAALYIARHGESVPPTLRWDQIPGYRLARGRIRAALRATVDALSAEEAG